MVKNPTCFSLFWPANAFPLSAQKNSDKLQPDEETENPSAVSSFRLL